MNTEYDYSHDNEILSYCVDIHNGKLEIFTQYYDNEKVAIIFIGYIAHRFEYVTYSNIINHIAQIPIDEFIDKNKALLEDGARNAFPIFTNNVEDLRNYLKKNGQKVFEINSTLGLCGFIFAKEISIEVIEG